MSKEGSAKSPVPTLDRATTAEIAKIFVVCDQKDPAPVWSYIVRQPGLTVFLETFIEKAIDRGSIEMPAKVRDCFI